MDDRTGVELRGGLTRAEDEITRLTAERDALDRSHKNLATRLADSGREFERLTRKMDAMRSVLRSVTCPRPANGDPDGISVEQCCVVLGHCGCDLGDALRGAHDQIATLEED